MPIPPPGRGFMGIYPVFLEICALVGAISAGFILAQSPRLPANRIAALLLASTAWWALCEGCWNQASDAAAALHWMRLSTPGWVFIGGLIPHLVARYLDIYPAKTSARPRRRLLITAIFGYAVGAVVLPCAWWEGAVHSEPVRVAWGWTYVPGPVFLVFSLIVGLPLLFAVKEVFETIRSPIAVAPPVQRFFIRVGVLTPVVMVLVTDVVLPVAQIPFPRFGSASYSMYALVMLVTGMRFGFSFITPIEFSDEILETLDDGVALVTPAGVVRRANRGLSELSGRPREELVGMGLRDLLDWHPPDEPSRMRGENGKVASACGDGIPVSVSSAPLRDARGNLLGTVVVVRDMREIKELRRRVLTQARLAAVGELAAGLAHEINNPLAFVRSNLAHLERHWKELCDPQKLDAGDRDEITAEGGEILHESLVGVDRAAEIVRGVCRFTHAGPVAREPADVNQLIEEALAMLRPQSRAEVIVELRLNRIPRVVCEPQELRQVFLNLLVNAFDAVGGRGNIQVATSREGGRVVVAVTDDGHGIDPPMLDRIFDPFFTTKGVGAGTGLGLGIAWHIVDAHGGHLEVDSTPGSGTTFRVLLPAEGTTRESAATG